MFTEGLAKNITSNVSTLLSDNKTKQLGEDDIIVDIAVANDISAKTKLLAQKTHEMIASSIKVAQNPSDVDVNQKFESCTKEVVSSLLDLKKMYPNDKILRKMLL